KLGLALSTYVLGMFYQMQNLNQYAYEYYSQAIPLFKEAKNWDYYDVAGINIIEVMKDEKITDGMEDIFMTLDSLCDVTIRNDMKAPLHIYNVMMTKGICSSYVYGKDVKKLKHYLNQTRMLYDEYSSYVVDSLALNIIERAYARLTGNIQNELKYTLAIHRNMVMRKEIANLGTEIKYLADCYEKLGDTRNAYKYLKRYTEFNDSLNLVIKKSSINNIAIEYNLDRLKEKNLQLTEEIMQSRRVVMILIFGLMVLILISLGLMVIHYRSTTKTLQRVNEMKTTFIRSITHEVNTPLNAVMGFSEVIADMANTEEQKNLAILVKENSTKLVRVVEDTLYLSDYDTGTIIDIKPTKVRISEVLRRIKERLAILFKDSTLDIIGNEELEVELHESSLETLLFNLIHNAMIHGEAPVKVEYGALSSGKIGIKVFDGGKKISKEILEHMYERFYKGDQIVDGLGVGLSIAKIAAERIGATIEYNDKYHIEGKEFIVTI
ncbi:MAG: HAMP domain-containing sensor histidine kinase, partial [Bacteroidia bacterium]|nr:HAMP domain-containing sensor histidine kinase [Bacteroidia bacterium]